MSPSDEIFQFPCDFPIKVIGRADDAFETTVLAIIHKHFPDMSELLSYRKSQQENYISITAIVKAQSREQLDALYQDLTADPNVLVAL